MTSNSRGGQADDVNKFLGFAAFNGIFLFVIAVNLLLLVGMFYYPMQVGVYVLVPYFTYTKILTGAELKDGSRWRWFSENFFMFSIMRRFLQLHVDVPKKLADADKEPNSQFIFGVFPHGTASDYRILMDGMMYDKLPNTVEKLRVLAASVLFVIPVVRQLAMWTGCVDARRSVAERALKKGNSVLVLPGGEAEQLRTIYGKERIYLKNRKGFIKLAMRNGVDAVPVYVFGASDLYYTSELFFGPRQWLQKNLGVCIPLAVGMWGSIFCALPTKTTVVFGEPVSFEMKEKGSPTNEELDVAHQKFCKSLSELFESHKTRLGYGDRELEIM